MSNGSNHRTVRLLVPDRSGRSLLTDQSGQLPSAQVELADDETTMQAVRRRVLPELALDGPIIECDVDQQGAADHPAAPVAALVELPAPRHGWPVRDGWRWIGLTDAEPSIEPGLATHLADLLDEHRGRRSVPELRAPWSRAGWYEQACTWIEQTLEQLRRPPATCIEQVRHWGISAVMRVDSADGPCWFKAVCPHFRHEPAISAFLDREMPSSVAPVVAVDATRRWLLLDDVGSQSLETNPVAHRPAVEALVAMQRAFADRTDELTAAGCPRRSLRTLPAELLRRLEDPVVRAWLHLAPERTGQLVAWLTDSVATIDALGVPDTLVHGDFHPGNIAIRHDAPVLIDWSDAAVAHPLLDFVTWASWLRDDEHRVDELWATFLAAWSDEIPVARFEQLRPMFEGVAGAYHTVSYVDILAGLEPTRRIEHVEGLTDFFALLQTAVPTS